MVLNMVPLCFCERQKNDHEQKNEEEDRRRKKRGFMACEVGDLFGGYIEMGSSGSFFIVGRVPIKIFERTGLF